MSCHYNTLPRRSIRHPIAIAQTIVSNPPDDRIARHDPFLIDDSAVPLIRNLRAIVHRYRQQIRQRTQLKK